MLNDLLSPPQLFFNTLCHSIRLVNWTFAYVLWLTNDFATAWTLKLVFVMMRQTKKKKIKFSWCLAWYEIIHCKSSHSFWDGIFNYADQINKSPRFKSIFLWRLSEFVLSRRISASIYREVDARFFLLSTNI